MKALFLAFLLASPAFAEDEAHRLDRLRTEQLNRQAAKAIDARDSHNDTGQRAYRAYRAARADYERRMASWRRQVAACNGGDWSACQ